MTVTASSNVGAVRALFDGDLAQGRAGAEWAPAPDDSSPWVHIVWRAPRSVAGVVLLGTVSEPNSADVGTTSVQQASLLFDEGDRVDGNDIPARADQSATVAVAPRMTTGVTIKLRQGSPSALLGLREIRFFGEGETPPVWTGFPPC